MIQAYKLFFFVLKLKVLLKHSSTFFLIFIEFLKKDENFLCSKFSDRNNDKTFFIRILKTIFKFG